MINKTTLIVAITTIGILYLIKEGRNETFNRERINNIDAGIVNYFKKGVNSTVNKLCSTLGNMTPRQLTTMSQLSNFTLRTIVK